jgi:UPF0755 protein
VVLGLLLAGCVDADAPLHPGDDAKVAFEVPKGATGTGVGKRLVEAGLVDSEWTWKLFLRSADARCLKAGKFELVRSMSLNDVLAALCGPPLADDVAFTVIEGWRIRDIDAALVVAGLAPAGAYTKAATPAATPGPFDVKVGTESVPTWEGYLYPETYKLPAKGFDPAVLVRKQLDTFRLRFLVDHPGDYGGRTLHEVVTMASMLEREEPSPSNRPLVAGILWKRIDAKNPLGVDATSRYTLDDWNDRKAFLQNLRDPNEPYNTRLKVGLPPGPIGNPTVPSLEAALAPVASEFWYYLHDHEGKLHPGRNAAEHEANRKKYDVY